MSDRPPRQGPTPAKAKEMLEHGEVHGKELTPAQRRLFWLIVHGKHPTRREADA